MRARSIPTPLMSLLLITAPLALAGALQAPAERAPLDEAPPLPEEVRRAIASTHDHDDRYLLKDEKAADSDLLDGLDASDYQRRVVGTCVSGSAIRAVDDVGGVACERVAGRSVLFGAGVGRADRSAYFTPTWQTTMIAGTESEGEVQTPVPVAAVLSNLLVRFYGDTGACPCVFAVRVNAEDSALQVTFAPGEASGTVKSNEDAVAVERGDLLSIRIQQGSSWAPRYTWSFALG